MIYVPDQLVQSVLYTLASTLGYNLRTSQLDQCGHSEAAHFCEMRARTWCVHQLKFSVNGSGVYIVADRKDLAISNITSGQACSYREKHGKEIYD